MGVEIPGHLRYTNDHEWVHVGSDSTTAITTVRMGLTAYASDALGDVVFVDLPAAGTVLQASESLGEVESTKSVSDVYAPITGTVTAVNEALASNPGLVNAEPYGEGWLLEIEVADVSDLDGLLDADAYSKLTGE